MNAHAVPRNRRIEAVAPPPSRAASVWRWLRRLGPPLVGITVLLGTWQALHAPTTLPISHINVLGADAHVTVASVKTRIAPLLGGFFNMDVEAIAQTVRRDPWVASVQVRRVWPDTLELILSEHRPVARWNAQALLSDSAKVFTPPAISVPPGLPQFAGPLGSEATVLAQWRRLNHALTGLGLNVQRLTLDTRRAWIAELDNGMALLLGRGDHPERIERFARLYPTTLAARAAEIAHVDLRYPNGLTVHWRRDGATLRKGQTAP